MNSPIVFVVSEPRRWDAYRGDWVRSINLNPARKFGELIFLLPPNNEAPADPQTVIRTLTDKLSGFSVEDFLLPVGSPLYIAWAAAIAADHTDGRLTLLHWQAPERCYAPVRVDLWPQDQSLPA